MHLHCIDFDECTNSSYHNCSESDYVTCTNTHGSFLCDCMIGFIMNEETKRCEGKKCKMPCRLEILWAYPAQISMNVTQKRYLLNVTVQEMRIVRIHLAALTVYAIKATKEMDTHVRVGLLILIPEPRKMAERLQ